MSRWTRIAGVVAYLPSLLACSAALSIPPSAPPSNVDRGVELFRHGDRESALAYLDEAVRERPEDARAWTYVGRCQLELGHARDAVASFQNAVSLTDEPEAHFGLGVAYGLLDRPSDALRHLERAVALNPTHGAAHYQLGIALHRAGARARARDHLARFIELAPHAPESSNARVLLRGYGATAR